MRELISLLGLRFYLFELRGSLTYTHTRNGKGPKVYEICESDIEDEVESESSSTESTTKPRPGVDASAVGVQLRLVKNDGLLTIEFEGKDGSAAQWTFDGNELLGGGSMVAAAATQTDVDEKKCLICGVEKRQNVEVKHEETQTDTTSTKSMETQTAAQTTSSSGVQVTPPTIPVHLRMPGALETLGPFINARATKRILGHIQEGVLSSMTDVRKVLDQNVAARTDFTLLYQETQKISTKRSQNRSSLKRESPSTSGKSVTPKTDVAKATSDFTGIGVQTESATDLKTFVHAEHLSLVKDISTHQSLKRKASISLETKNILNKRAKSQHNAQQWPRHLYMDCFRNTPIFKGGVGTLHIDVQEGTAFFEGCYGKEGMRVQERKQIDLRDKSTRISYELLHRSGIDNATYDLCVDRLSAKGETITLFHADCSAPGWKMFGLDVAYFSFEKPPVEDMIPIADAHVIVDALVYCIDVASCRGAVHDPDMEYKLRKEVED
ncbi:hypothetical protein HBH49_002790 [Parastagonospora nodorum]|nr:hypothetical protein HBH49_002790 [Parastagonospora nodorum]